MQAQNRTVGDGNLGGIWEEEDGFGKMLKDVTAQCRLRCCFLLSGVVYGYLYCCLYPLFQLLLLALGVLSSAVVVNCAGCLF